MVIGRSGGIRLAPKHHRDHRGDEGVAIRTRKLHLVIAAATAVYAAIPEPPVSILLGETRQTIPVPVLLRVDCVLVGEGAIVLQGIHLDHGPGLAGQTQPPVGPHRKPVHVLVAVRIFVHIFVAAQKCPPVIRSIELDPVLRIESPVVFPNHQDRNLFPPMGDPQHSRIHVGQINLRLL